MRVLGYKGIRVSVSLLILPEGVPGPCGNSAPLVASNALFSLRLARSNSLKKKIDELRATLARLVARTGPPGLDLGSLDWPRGAQDVDFGRSRASIFVSFFDRSSVRICLRFFDDFSI